MSRNRSDRRMSAARRRWVLACLCLAVLMFTIDHLIVNTALITIQRDLAANGSQQAWFVDAFTLALAGLLMPFGKLGDRLGRRPMLLVGVCVFGLASLFASRASSADGLIACRYAMGAGAGMVFPAALGIIRAIFSGKGRGAALGIWSAVGGVGLAAGPLLGGWLLRHFAWGSIFLVNVPVCVLIVAGAIFLVPKEMPRDARKLDLVGSGLVAVAMSALVWGVIEAPSLGWLNKEIIAAFAGFLVLAVVWVIWEAHSDHAMVDLTWFRSPSFSVATVALGSAYFGVVGALYALTLWLQIVKGYTPFEAGLRIAPVAAALMPSALFAVRISERRGPRWVVAAGLALVAVGLGLFSRTGAHTSYWFVLIALLLAGVGMGAAMAPSQTSIINSIAPELAGAGSAVADSWRYFMSSAGVAVVSSLLATIYHSRIQAALMGLPPAYANAAHDSVGAAATAARALARNPLTAAEAAKLSTLADQAFVSGLHWAVFVAAVAGFIGSLCAALWLRRPASVWDKVPGTTAGAQHVLAVLNEVGSELNGQALLAGPLADLYRLLRALPQRARETVLGRLGCEGAEPDVERAALALGLMDVLRGRIERQGDELIVSVEGGEFRVGSGGRLVIDRQALGRPSEAVTLAAAAWRHPPGGEIDVLAARAAQIPAALWRLLADAQPRCEPLLPLGIGVQTVVAKMDEPGELDPAWAKLTRHQLATSFVLDVLGADYDDWQPWWPVRVTDAGTAQTILVMPDGRIPNAEWQITHSPA